MKFKTIKKTAKYFVTIALLSSAFSPSINAQQNEPLLNFKFKHLSNIQTNTEVVPAANSSAVNFAQYDATWTYPWETLRMNIDLGVTLRHLTGFAGATDDSLVGSSYFQKTLPLVHASAQYAFSLKGLSAGIEGSHLDSSKHQVFDFRAKVSYEWRKGFGMQGGWQHQQFKIDNAINVGTDFEKNGPFIDLYLNF